MLKHYVLCKKLKNGDVDIISEANFEANIMENLLKISEIMDMGSVKTLKVTATKTFQRDIKKLTAKQQFSVEMTEVLYLLQRNRPLPKKILRSLTTR